MKTIRKLEVVARRTRLAEAEEPYNSKITEPARAAAIARGIIRGRDREIFVVLLLDVKNRVTSYVEAGTGGIDTCPVDPREVFRAAVMAGATAVIIAHNHPSGDTTPSAQDIELTERVAKGGELLGICVLDHVIVTDDSYTSMAERGMLPKKIG